MIRSVIFDLGGVLFARDPSHVTGELMKFFSFIGDRKMPEFWEEYDRGAVTLEQTMQHLCALRGCSREVCEEFIEQSIRLQGVVAPTGELVKELKARGYKLYVLSNMAREYIAELRQREIYSYFDGDVVSCEEHTVKPEQPIYEILLERYNLNPAESIFIDDRIDNLVTAERVGLRVYHFELARAQECCNELRKIIEHD